MKFDIHVHTNLSPCSQIPLTDLLAEAPFKGVQGICITDHDTMDVRKKIKEGVQSNGLCVLFGQEYSTQEGDFLLFGPFEQLIPGLSANLLLQYVGNSGGVAIAAHPFRKGRSVSEHLIKKQLCTIVEGVNGRNSQQENEAVLSWQVDYGLKPVGGSDAHTLDEVGSVSTHFTTPITDRADFIRALKRGDFQHVVPQKTLTRQVV